MRRQHSPDDPYIAWAVIEELRADNANHDPDDVMADETAAVEEVRAARRRVHRRRPNRTPVSTLADGFQSIPALQPPKSEEEIAAIVADERAERARTRIEQATKAQPVARTPAKRQD